MSPCFPTAVLDTQCLRVVPTAVLYTPCLCVVPTAALDTQCLRVVPTAALAALLRGPLLQHGGFSEDRILHPNHQTGYFRQNHVRAQNSNNKISCLYKG